MLMLEISHDQNWYLNETVTLQFQVKSNTRIKFQTSDSHLNAKKVLRYKWRQTMITKFLLNQWRLWNFKHKLKQNSLWSTLIKLGTQMNNGSTILLDWLTRIKERKLYTRCKGSLITMMNMKNIRRANPYK